MLPRVNRLKKKKDIELVFKKGQGFREGYLFFKLNKNNLKVSRFAFIVGLKVSKKATVRNKIKRKLREVVQERLPETKKGFDVALVVIKNPEGESYRNLEKTIKRLFQKAKIWRE